MTTGRISSPEELEHAVSELGFLPFFENGIPGFSLEERTPDELWFKEGVDGPWEWKGPVARSKVCAYGKLFSGKAGFVSLEWFPELVNYRRKGYDFDLRYEDGLVGLKDKQIYDAIQKHGSMLTKGLKAYCGFGKTGQKGFDSVITRLQMQTYIVVADFEYMRDMYGRPYGWGVARYTTPEALFGEDTVTAAYHRKPEESRARILEHLTGLLPGADADKLEKLIRG